MDPRALLAIVFLLWLIRTWVKWDLQVKNAEQSRLRLRDRLADSMLRQRLGARVETQASTDIDPVNGIDSASPAFESPDEGDVVSSVQRKQGLQEQLRILESQAKASRQSDLELRRLRSELDSVPSEGSVHRPDIDALEKRIQEQQAVLAQNAEMPETGTVQGLSQSEPTERTPQQSTSPEALNSESSSVGSAKKTPLYQAPSERDDLKQIKGIGPVMERTLNELGVTTFRQLADFTQADIDKVSDAIGAFSGRIERDDWVGKAQKLVSDKSSA